MTSKKRSTVFLVALAGLLGSFALLAGPAGAEQSGTAVADDSSVASGNATAVDESTASGDSVAVGGSVASGCSFAEDHSTASGDSCRRHHDRHHGPAPSHGPAKATRVQSLALTGSSSAPMALTAAAFMFVGGALVLLASDRSRHAVS